MTQIFLSYRRADSDVIAGRIRDRLARAFGEDSVFMDIDNIPFGVDFRSHVKESLLRGDLVIAVIGPNWLGMNEAGRSRLEDETDPVRVELEAALERHLPVIPALVHGARMPRADELPPSLRDLAFYNAANVDAGRDFHPHLDRLIRSINGLVKDKPGQRYRRWGVAGGLISIAAIAGIIVFNRVSYSPTEPIAINSPKQEQATAKQAKDQQPGTGAAAQEPWRSLLSIRVAELKSNIDELRASGYLLRTMNGYVVGGVEHYATLWNLKNNETDAAGWEFESASYQKRQDDLAKRGRRPIFISAYEGRSGIRYADVWARGNSSDWIVRREMSAEMLSLALKELATRGLHAVHVYGYSAGSASQFIAIFERHNGEPNIVSIDTPAAENQKVWDENIKQGYRPTAISGYRIANSDYLTTLWEKGRRGGASQFGVTEKNVDSVIAARKNQDLRLVYVSAYSGLGGARFNLIWDR